MRKCEVCNKTEKDGKIIKYKYIRFFCWRHYLQFKRHGEILKRTKYDKNQIVVVNNDCHMLLYNLSGNPIANTYFNKKHLAHVSQNKWCLSSTGHVINFKNNILLHQLIKGNKPGYEIDHKDGNKLNNLDSNLRFATHQQNVWNKYSKGIYWDKSRNKWVARLYANGKVRLHKRFDAKEEAIKARREAEQKYFGEFAFKRVA